MVCVNVLDFTKTGGADGAMLYLFNLSCQEVKKQHERKLAGNQAPA